MAIFLIEIHMAKASAKELARAVRTLASAESRLLGSANIGGSTVIGFSREDGRLICLVEADDVESVRALLGLAFLTPARRREITDLPEMSLVGAGHPGGDGDPGVEAKLVEDVVDVGLDGALGQE
jgi:hypothetical protein